MINTIKSIESRDIIITFDSNHGLDQNKMLQIANQLINVFPEKRFIFMNKNIDLLEITEEERQIIENILKRNNKSIEYDTGNSKDYDEGDNNGQKDNSCN